MGDLYHDGRVVGGNSSIDDSSVDLHKTWSSKKVSGELEKTTSVNIVPISTVVSSITTHLPKKHGIVFGNIMVSLSSTAPSRWLDIGTIDTPPKYEYWGVCVNGSTTGYSGVYQIQTDGKVRIYAKDSTTAPILVGVCYEAES